MQAQAVAVTPADPESVWAWWTDYAPDDHAHGSFARYAQVTRRVIWRDPGKSVEFVDEGKVFGLPVVARTVAEFHGSERVSARVESNRGNLETEHWFEAMPGGGTRITARVAFHPPAKARLVAPFTRPALETALAHDLQAHVSEFERSGALK